MGHDITIHRLCTDELVAQDIKTQRFLLSRWVCYWVIMKKWHEEKPFTFGIVFLILYTMLDVADARWFIPRMRPVCNGEITDNQAKACSGWIRKINNKEQNDVRVIKRGLGKLHRNLTPDADSEWNGTLDAFGRKPDTK